jgi:hypothetical protein
VKKLLLLFIPLLLVPAFGVAQTGTQSVFRFLNVPASAQAAALGGGPVSLVNGNPAQMHLNPAFLHQDMSGTVAATWARYLAEADMAFLSGVWHADRIGTLGFGIRYVNYGEFERIDIGGNTTGDFIASDMAFKLALSRRYGANIRYGVAADFIYSSLDVYRSTGLSISGGLILDLPDHNASFGFSVINLGSQLSTYNGIREELPLDVRFAASRKLQYLPLRLSLGAHSLHRWEMRSANDTEEPGFAANLFRHVIIGGEFLFSENFHFRLGYNHFQHDDLKAPNRIDLAGFGIGVAIRVKTIGFEVSRTSHSEMGHLLQLGIQTRF